LQFTTNEIAVLNAKSGVMFGCYLDLGIEPKNKTKAKEKNQTIHMLLAFKCCFQFISSVELIPILKINSQLD
jgi:hypothetical protein